MYRKKIGLALGSGAVRGYAIMPIIKQLEKENIIISAVSGSSVGALIGAYYCLHGEINSLFESSKDLEKKDFMKLVDINNPKISLIKGNKIKEFLKEKYFGDKTFKDTKIPLYVCATDIVKKRPVYLTKGRILDAVMASISIPGIFPPYKINNRIFVDGGVLDPVPVKPLQGEKIKKIVGVNLTGFKSGKAPGSDESLISVLMSSFYMMMERLAAEESNKNLFMINFRFEPDPARMLAFFEWEQNYRIGQGMISKKIKSLREWLAS